MESSWRPCYWFAAAPSVKGGLLTGVSGCRSRMTRTSSSCPCRSVTDTSHSTVTQIAEDRSGFLWFGTKDGLKRYDGYRFREFRPEAGNPRSLSGLVVESLLNDRSGKLWVASDLNVDRFDPAAESFAHFPSGQSVLKGPIHHINQDRAGMIWLSTAHGLIRIDPATGRMTRYLTR